MAEKTEPATCDSRLLKAKFSIQSGRDSAPAFESQHAPRKSGGRASRKKGHRAERALVRALQDKSFAAERVPLSGSAGGRYCGDLTVPIIGRDHVVEVKVRGRDFTRLYQWLEGRDILVVRADRRQPLVVVPLALAIEIAAAAERNKRGDA